jgi:hypothetical protein
MTGLVLNLDAVIEGQAWSETMSDPLEFASVFKFYPMCISIFIYSLTLIFCFHKFFMDF